MQTSKTLVIYNYYQENPNTDYFFENGLSKDDSVDYVFIANNLNLSLPKNITDEYDNVSIYNRENSGRDYAAYSYIVNLKKEGVWYPFLR